MRYVCLILALFFTSAVRAEVLVMPLAGRGAPDSTISPRFTGDGGPATLAQLLNPFDVVADAKGNWYVLDTSHQLVRQINPVGTISTVAGRHIQAPTATPLSSPMGLVYGAGELYVADTFNHRVQKVDAHGVVTVIAGTGQRGFGGDGGPASEAMLANPSGLGIDADGTLYIADQGNHRIRKIDPAGVISTVAGTGDRGYVGDGGDAKMAHLADPSGVFWHAGVLYIADRSNHVIRKIDDRGIISTVAGVGTPGIRGDGGLALEAQLKIPSRVVVDPLGQLLIADRGNSRIRRVDKNGLITTVLGLGAVRFNRPFGIGLNAQGEMVIADTENHKLWRIDAAKRSLWVQSEKQTLAADGQDQVGILVTLSDLGNDEVTFRIVQGNGELSVEKGTGSGGMVGTQLTSQWPGTVVVEARAAGALSVVSQTEVSPVRTLDLTASGDRIASNGDDEVVFESRLSAGTGDVAYRLVEGEGQLDTENGTARFRSTVPGYVVVEATVPGAIPVTLPVVVTKPKPWQIADKFELQEAQGVIPELTGNFQARTFHTPGDVDRFTLPVHPGYGFALIADGDTPITAQVFHDGAQIESFDLPGEVFAGQSSEPLEVQLVHKSGIAGAYGIRVERRRTTRLKIEFDQTTLAGDGVEGVDGVVYILDRFGQVDATDDTTQVRFAALGQVRMSPVLARVKEGVARTRLVGMTPNEVIVNAEIAGVAPVQAFVDVLPALVLESVPGSDVQIVLGAFAGVQGATGVRALIGYDPNVLTFHHFEPVGALVEGVPLIVTPALGQAEIHVAILGGTIPSDGGRLGVLHFKKLADKKTLVSLLEGDYGTQSGVFPFGIGEKTGRVTVGDRDRFQEFLSFSKAFGKSRGQAQFDVGWDLDDDGTVGFTDFLIWLEQQ